MEKNNEQPKKSLIAEKEEKILKSWQENKIFEKSLEQTKDGKPFVFYDGPPFATGLPHYGHLLAGTIKDAIPRYKTMQGRYVRRQWGWDCHGLPVENLIEKELKLEHKKDIEEYGIGKFNEAAKKSVLRYDADWKRQVPRMGRFVDMEASYKTMDWTYTESIWWMFKELYSKGLVYEGNKSMYICPRCETVLANSEVAQGYKDVKDISVTVEFELVDPIRTDSSKEPISNGAGEPKTFVLAWTTTPWTLPGNVALAVGEDIEYVVIEKKDEGDGDLVRFVLAKAKLEKVFGDEGYKIVKEIKGKDLVGRSYKPVFDYYAKNKQLENRENARPTEHDESFGRGWKIYGADFVTTESGTGIVHIAPAFGDDDMRLGKENNLPFVQHVNMDGTFKKDVKEFAGLSVKPKDNPQETDIEIIKYLAHNNLLFAKEKITHSYPHCWRCDTPLINYATSSWFIEVTKLRNKLVRENKKVTWIPKKIGEARFGNWLSGARDWAISRSRFWGAPLPVWKCTDCEKIEVLGSIEEIKNQVKKSGNNYFVMRHGRADSNEQGIVSGKIDNQHHLVDDGKKQVKKAVQGLKRKHIDMIFVSPFIRTMESANIVAKNLGLSQENIIIDERIKEIWTGEFEGKPVEQYRAYFNTHVERFTKRPEGGETYRELKQRVTGFLYDLEKKYKNKNILIVTHESPLWMLLAGSRGLADEDAIEISGGEDNFFMTGIVKELNFVPIPHNDNYELDLHRPYIDDIKLECECGGEMSRVPEVFDCWIESGSMPFAQFHYPFENKKEFKKNFPADFIAEGLDQTRGWFYTLLVLSTGLFRKSPYKNVIVNGTVLTEDGQKMSKRLKNYPDPMEVVDKYGADAVRYYMLSSPVVHGEDFAFSEKGVDEVYKKNILRLGNVVSFYEMYVNNQKNTTNNTQPESENILDKWIVARLNELIKEVTNAMDGYELDKATRPIADFVDDLSTWYIRRSRERFKGDDAQDKEQALLTTHYLLLTLSKTIAPFMPFMAEDIYNRVGGEKAILRPADVDARSAGDGLRESVHLESWPKLEKIDEKVLKEMNEVRRIVSLGLEARAKAGIKVRQPLASIVVKQDTISNAEELSNLIKDEVNVKEVIYNKKIEEEVEIVTDISPELKKEGDMRDLLRQIQDLRKKKGLQTDDSIIMYVETSAIGKELINKFEQIIKNTALINKIVYEKVLDGHNIKIGENTFIIHIENNE